MRLHQTWKNYLAQFLVERRIPVLSRVAIDRLVALHVDFFAERSRGDGEGRRPHLRALFDAAIAVYRRALAEGFPEAEAREITHIQASWDFQNHGWGELIEFPPQEREAYFERYRDFYERHDCSPDDPLGAFAPAGGLPAAPETPERMSGDYPLAVPGLTDDIYLDAERPEARLSCDAPARG